MFAYSARTCETAAGSVEKPVYLFGLGVAEARFGPSAPGCRRPRCQDADRGGELHDVDAIETDGCLKRRC